MEGVQSPASACNAYSQMGLLPPVAAARRGRIGHNALSNNGCCQFRPRPAMDGDPDVRRDDDVTCACDSPRACRRDQPGKAA